MEIINKFENDKSVYQLESDRGAIFICRIVKETGKMARFGYYMFIDRQGDAVIRRIDAASGVKIIKEALSDDNLSSALVVVEDISQKVELNFQDKGLMERLYTSTGEKFLYHPQAIESFRQKDGKTIISTHVSPEGRCNLRCPYCSVAYRTSFDRIALDRIKAYIHILRPRGLKAVILTGGGEPTLYPQINELIEFIHDECKLELAMITNATTLERVRPDNQKKFCWLRISVNIFEGWEQKIHVPDGYLTPATTVGMSYIMTAEHEFTGDEIDSKDIIARIIKLMDRYNAKYLRILPNCLIKGEKFNYQHKVIARLTSAFHDERIFHQLKTHEIPEYETCYQSYFRPYLSEEPNPWDRKPGCVFPCDSLVLNDSVKKFEETYALCEPERIGDYLDGKIKGNFDPRVNCHGCVFVNNNRLLAELIKLTAKRPAAPLGPGKILHKNFV